MNKNKNIVNKWLTILFPSVGQQNIRPMDEVVEDKKSTKQMMVNAIQALRKTKKQLEE